MTELTPEEIKTFIVERTGDTYLTDHYMGVLEDLCEYQVAQLAKAKESVCPECEGTGMGRFYHNSHLSRHR